MIPTLKPGQEILVSSLPFLIFKPKAGDIVAFKGDDKVVVKRVKKVAGDKQSLRQGLRLQVIGDNRNDSKDYGWIERKRIIGKVIYTLS